MNTKNRLIVFVCALFLAFSLVGCGSSSTATSHSGKADSAQRSVEGKSAQVSNDKQEDSKDSSESPVDEKFLGHWIGYDSYTTDGVNVSDTMLLSDANSSATLDITSDGTAQLDFTANGQLNTFLFQMEKGQSGNGYVLYDEADTLQCTLEYGGQNGPVSWLVLATPNSDSTMFC
ncbi:MAG: hypothetical protein Q4D23_11375, partial [Bacteroidales bacterium]|nr:hypothetical protein [Bacteroidales bacterium]